MDCAPSKLSLNHFCLLINVLFPQKTIESETVKTSEVIKKKLEEITGTVKEVKGPFLRAALLKLGCWGAGIVIIGGGCCCSRGDSDPGAFKTTGINKIMD